MQVQHGNTDKAISPARHLQTACGCQMFIPPKAQAHLQAHPEVSDILSEAIGRLVLPNRAGFVEAEVDMGRPVGRAGLVKTPLCDADSPMLFAQRVGRAAPSRVVPSDTLGEETAKVVIVAMPSRDQAGAYALVTAWVGTLACKEPWDRNIKTPQQYQDCLQFWCAHALIHDPEIMGSVFESTWEEVMNGIRSAASN